jgi:hypothetical protein
MVSRKPHPAELRERAVKMVLELRAEQGAHPNGCGHPKDKDRPIDGIWAWATPPDRRAGPQTVKICFTEAGPHKKNFTARQRYRVCGGCR